MSGSTCKKEIHLGGNVKNLAMLWTYMFIFLLQAWWKVTNLREKRTLHQCLRPFWKWEFLWHFTFPKVQLHWRLFAICIATNPTTVEGTSMLSAFPDFHLGCCRTGFCHNKMTCVSKVNLKSRSELEFPTRLLHFLGTKITFERTVSPIVQFSGSFFFAISVIAL